MVLVFVCMRILFTIYFLGYLSKVYFVQVRTRKSDTFSCLTGGTTLFLYLVSPVMRSYKSTANTSWLRCCWVQFRVEMWRTLATLQSSSCKQAATRWVWCWAVWLLFYVFRQRDCAGWHCVPDEGDWQFFEHEESLQILRWWRHKQEMQVAYGG